MRSMNGFIIIAAMAGTMLSGCLNMTPPASSAEAHGLTLTATSSASVQVNGPRLQMNKGNLELAGSIAKQMGASSTAFSHVDILFCNASGRVLKTKPLQFIPQSVGHSRLGRRLGYYSLTLEPLPDGTARIEVKAHDADIAVPHN